MIKIKPMLAADIDIVLEFGLKVDRRTLLILIKHSGCILLTAEKNKETIGFFIAVPDPDLQNAYIYIIISKERIEKEGIMCLKFLKQAATQLQALAYNDTLELAQLDNETVKDFSIRYALQISELLNSSLK